MQSRKFPPLRKRNLAQERRQSESHVTNVSGINQDKAYAQAVSSNRRNISQQITQFQIVLN